MVSQKRYLAQAICEDLVHKMVFLGGPRQVGKTTLATDLVGTHFSSAYYNWDKLTERQEALAGKWPPSVDLVILDEFHKYSKWKTWLKGEYDTLKGKYHFLLTGSARLTVYRRGGDSLQGRYHFYRLHPFSLAEVEGLSPKTEIGAELVFQSGEGAQITKTWEDLFHYGGFPEPFLSQDERNLRRWHNERMERFFKEDIRDLTRIQDLGSLSVLAGLLPERASAILSLNSLAGDLGVNYRTLAHWLEVFEQFYYCFRLSPYHTRSIAAVRKEKKLYLWDWAQVPDKGARLENAVASHLLKYCDYLFDREGIKAQLHYLRDSTGREVDFLVTLDKKPWFAVEVKTQDEALSKSFLYFKEKMKIPYCYQVLGESTKDFVKSDVRVMPVSTFLTAFV